MTTKPRLRIVSDYFNNVNRMCTIASASFPNRMHSPGRVWRITTPMVNVTPERLERWYACVNVRTGERVIAPVLHIGNLY